MHLYFCTADFVYNPSDFESTSIGDFHVEGNYEANHAMLYCCGKGAIFYTPSSQDEIDTLTSELPLGNT